MAKLAIKGHETRGKEVIEILEMLGGNNKHDYSANCDNLCFFCGKGTNTIYYDWVNNRHRAEDTTFFTLEEFIEKYPYKVGDKVIFTKYGDNDVVTVESMSWTGTTIEYNYNGGASCLAKDLQPYKEEIIEDKSDLLQQLKEYFDNTPREIVEKEWHEYDKYNEISQKVNEYLEYVNNIRHHKYPKNYKECCDVLGICPNGDIVYAGNWTYGGEYLEKHLEKIRNFQKLLICRDAYWKIAGEQIGLSKPWEPRETKDRYIIRRAGDKIVKGYNISSVLEFPTPEMRDAFYVYFESLIRQCKELL